MSRIQAAFFNDGVPFLSGDPIDYVYGHGRRRQIEQITDLHPVVVTSENFAEEAPRLRDTEVIFSTWGMPRLEADQFAALPKLRAFFYAAGSVKTLAQPFLERDITVVSAWAANAISVAEFCLGQILLSCKGYFRNTRDCQTPDGNHQTIAFQGKGAYGEKIAIIGAGQIGRQLICLLKPFRLKILVVDPYLSEPEAEDLGVTKVSMADAFSQAYVVSNHLPNLPELQRVLDRPLFASMRQDATFINTGRGAQVNEADLIGVLKQRPDLMALLDVTDPEPCLPDCGFYHLPNVQISSHLAGAHNDEVVRMADTVIEEFTRWQNGDPLRYQITQHMLERMA